MIRKAACNLHLPASGRCHRDAHERIWEGWPASFGSERCRKSRSERDPISAHDPGGGIVVRKWVGDQATLHMRLHVRQGLIILEGGTNPVVICMQNIG